MMLTLSQSLSTDQGSSDSHVAAQPDLAAQIFAVSIPQYRSGQFRRGPSFEHRIHPALSVSIPQYRSGQFRP